MSARACSRANSVFFEAKPLAAKEPPHRVMRDLNPAGRQVILQPVQRQVRRSTDPLDDELPVRIEQTLAMSAHLAGRHRPRCAIPLRPLRRRGHRDAEPCRHRAAALAGRDRADNPFAYIFGKRCCHRMLASSPASILNHKPEQTGIPKRFRQSLNRSRGPRFTFFAGVRILRATTSR